MFKSAHKEQKQTLRQYLRNVSLLHRGKSADSFHKQIEENSNPLKSIQSKALQIVEICSSISSLSLQKVHHNSFLTEFSQQIQKFCDKIRDFLTNEKAKIEREQIPKSSNNFSSPRSLKLKVKSRQCVESTSIFHKVNQNQMQQYLASNKIAETPEIKRQQYNPQEKALEPSKRIDNIFGSRTIASYQIINVDGFTGNNKRRKRRTGQVFQNFG